MIGRPSNVPVYRLYVIELGPSARRDPRFDHSARDPAKPCLYVGSTAKELEERYADHRDGMWTQARATRRHGCVALRRDLCGHIHALSRIKAEELEVRLAEQLRRKGYGVDQH